MTFAVHNFSRLVMYNRDGECLLRGTHSVSSYKTEKFSLQRVKSELDYISTEKKTF